MTLRDYLHVLRRRKWIVIVPVVLAPIIAGVLAHRQPKLYKASAQVTVSQQDLPSSVLDFSAPTQQEDPVRLLATQAQFARLPAIAQRAVSAAGVPNESASDLLAASTVTPSQTDDFLTFMVSDARRDRATRLASAYAGQYVAYFRQYQSAQLAAASRAVQGQIQELAREGRQSSPLYANLVGKANQLAAAAAIAGTTGAVVSATQRQSGWFRPPAGRHLRVGSRAGRRHRSRLPARCSRSAGALCRGDGRPPPAPPAGTAAAAAAVSEKGKRASDSGRSGQSLRGALSDAEDEYRVHDRAWSG